MGKEQAGIGTWVICISFSLNVSRQNLTRQVVFTPYHKPITGIFGVEHTIFS
jgi:hypothetical protein